MSNHKRLALVASLVVLPLAWGATLTSAAPIAPAAPPQQGPADVNKIKEDYKDKAEKTKEAKAKEITQKQRDEAAARALQDGALNPLMTVTAAAAPGDAPRYFSHPNYANSPLPEVGIVAGEQTVVGNPLEDRAYASDYPVGVGELAPVFVVVDQALTEGFLTAFQSWNQATAGGSPFPSAGNVFHAYVLRPTGNANEYTVLFDSGQLLVPALAAADTSESVSYGVANFAVAAGDRIAFYGQGIPVDTDVGSDILSYPAPTAPLQDTNLTLGSAEYPVLPSTRTYSFGATLIGPDQTSITGGIKKFVDELPEIPAATPDTTSYPGSDFYRIGLVEYSQRMYASDIPTTTTLRGYVQLNADLTTMGEPSYLGPAIVAQKDKPVRIEFHNLLPTGAEGNLFLPVDTTVMGSGMTPEGHEMMESMPDLVDPQVPMCNDLAMKSNLVASGDCYSDNRAIIHLHGGITPWISDGT
ncbi:MAG TPA: hypothetical protein VLQ67_14975, partial [Arachnia sp.]|nr:hypothetical protein [Arachnia sp.]